MEKTSFALGELKFAQGDAMSFSGYGAVFGNVDAYGDVIVPGAFAKSLAAHKADGTMPAMLLEHGMSSAPLPIGVWKSMAEDGHGLKVEGELLPTGDGRDTYVAMKHGAMGGLSIGYKTIEFQPRRAPEEPRRMLKELQLFEVSPVVFPANGKARVESVKSFDELLTIRDFEEALARGMLPPLSMKEAKALLAGGFKAIRPERDAGGMGDELADMIRRNILSLTKD